MSGPSALGMGGLRVVDDGPRSVDRVVVRRTVPSQDYIVNPEPAPVVVPKVVRRQVFDRTYYEEAQAPPPEPKVVEVPVPVPVPVPVVKYVEPPPQQDVRLVIREPLVSPPAFHVDRPPAYMEPALPTTAYATSQLQITANDIHAGLSGVGGVHSASVQVAGVPVADSSFSAGRIYPALAGVGYSAVQPTTYTSRF